MTTHYGDYGKEFYRLEAKDYKTVNAALDELLRDPQGFKTFVLDSFTVLYENIILGVEARLKAKHGNPAYSIQPTDYKIVKSEIKTIINKIMNLDMNVVVTARAKTRYAKGEFMKEDGTMPDCPEWVPFEFDVILELFRERNAKVGTAITWKDRTNTLPMEFEYTYEKFVEYMGIEGLEREPLLINQQKSLEAQSLRSVSITYNGGTLMTAGVTAEQLEKISEIVESDDSGTTQKLLKDNFYADSFLDLREDEANDFITQLTKED